MRLPAVNFNEDVFMPIRGAGSDGSVGNKALCQYLQQIPAKFVVWRLRVVQFAHCVNQGLKS